MATYYRFQNDAPKPNELVHCFRNKTAFIEFVYMMKGQDPQFSRMKFWEIEGVFVKPDDEDAVVRVISVKQIRV